LLGYSGIIYKYAYFAEVTLYCFNCRSYFRAVTYIAFIRFCAAARKSYFVSRFLCFFGVSVIYKCNGKTVLCQSFCNFGTDTSGGTGNYGYIYIDSGAMYRAVTLYSMENGIFTAEGIDTEKLKKQINSIRISFQLNPETGRPDTYLNGINVEKKIRTMEVSSRVSPIAALDFVREAMVAQQQEMGKAKGIVMDGRDIGTTVFPDAELKIFVTASPEIRAQRRYDELKAKGEEAGFDEILENVKQRDYIDQNREVSPLRKADDALLLDNSHMTISQQKEWLAEQFEKVCKS
jgi:cytidylate kinase